MARQLPERKRKEAALTTLHSEVSKKVCHHARTLHEVNTCGHLPPAYTVDTQDGNGRPVRQKSWRDCDQTLPSYCPYRCHSLSGCLACNTPIIFPALFCPPPPPPLSCTWHNVHRSHSLSHCGAANCPTAGFMYFVSLAASMRRICARYYILWVNLIVFPANINVVACLHQLL